MPTDTVFYRWVPREINPPEAREIGNDLFAAGFGLQLLSTLLDLERERALQSWSGKAQGEFYEDRGFGRAPARLRELGELIESHDKQIREITVTVWEQVPIRPDEIQWE